MKTLYHCVLAILISVLFYGCVFASEAEKHGPAADNYLTSTNFRAFDYFPKNGYTPFGYLANPYHTAVIDRSGVFRSVPPLGFGFWVRPLPWPYGGADFGFGLSRQRNYLSLLHLSIEINGKMLHSLEDFKKNKIKLYSRYHTKNMMSYNFKVDKVRFRAMYFQVRENSLICLLRVKNTSDSKRKITVHASNIYGDIYQGYWGCDGIVSLYNEQADASVSKFFAEGDTFALAADRKTESYKATTNDKTWHQWITNNNMNTTKEAYTNLHFNRKNPKVGETLGHMISVNSYQCSVSPGRTKTMTIGLSRGMTEEEAINRVRTAIDRAAVVLEKKLVADKGFYANAPVLTGDWPRSWKNGMIYHLETIRMNIHPPIGIYDHYWDGMQVHTPRVVLGESSLDSMCLSYADIELAKDVMLGTFEDAVADNIPCSREDGSLNLVCGNGKETGTAPIWGLPFHVIRSIYLRDGDEQWIKKLYPHMKEFIEWWLENRTDDKGWFHCACSWESGQDASKRFLVGEAAASAENVRTVDIEAAMADAIRNMVLFAKVSGNEDDIYYWKELAEKRIKRTRNMFVDGRFRDFDSRTGEPIILEDYYSVMMLAPIALDIATPNQIEQSEAIFDYFKENYRFWLEWPSFMFPFTEAAWNAGRRELLSKILVNSGNGIFPGMDSRSPLYIEPDDAPGLSQEYSYRLPGVGAEWWPYKRGDKWAGGCENYGWGATFPTLLIRNLIGFREIADFQKDQFHLAPALTEKMFKQGKSYGIANLSYRGTKIDIKYKVKKEGKVNIEVKCKCPHDKIKLLVKNESGEVKAKTHSYSIAPDVSFEGQNYRVYAVTVLHQEKM